MPQDTEPHKLNHEPTEDDLPTLLHELEGIAGSLNEQAETLRDLASTYCSSAHKIQGVLFQVRHKREAPGLICRVAQATKGLESLEAIYINRQLALAINHLKSLYELL